MEDMGVFGDGEGVLYLTSHLGLLRLEEEQVRRLHRILGDRIHQWDEAARNKRLEHVRSL